MTTAIATKLETVAALSAIVDRAVAVLSNARTAAEVLEAREIASDVYDRTATTVSALASKETNNVRPHQRLPLLHRLRSNHCID